MVNYLYRALMTYLGYVIFGLCGILFSLYLLGAAACVPRAKREGFARRQISGVWKGFIAYLRATGVIHYRIEHAERLGKPGQLILANHPSLLDVLLLIAEVPGSNCVVKASLLDNWILKIPMRLAGYIPYENSEETLHEAIASLSRGDTLIIFPEGTRTGYDGVINCNRGAVTLGMHGAQEIIPVRIEMRPLGLKKHDRFYHVPKTAYHYHLTVGEAIDVTHVLKNRPLPAVCRQYHQQILRFFQQED